ncbi:survival protein sure-like phosphatase/nucleotidase [Dichotomopilus funicola]|uniref:Survival protein sure-like phosphatase/nucleotidase n=1 Tax=Dichotomopilus funicola TaxID=1934379 RepID=A0AAN6UVJ7_9PEZI|nr:survival protein sure-like phosphatase/nucleotidase [Dichotomopilus funicola]
MRAEGLLAVLSAVGANGIRIIQANDDGWAEQYARSFHNGLIAAGHDAVLSAPAENKSGTGSSDAEPSPRASACQYNSCPANSGPIGRNETDPRLNWVNSYPATSMRYGIDTIGPQLWDGAAPEFAVAGPNVGSNLFLAVQFSGTVGAAVYAAKTAKIPSIAFSGASDGTIPFSDPEAPRSKVYADLATSLTNAVIDSGMPYLPEGVWLNVNFPKVEGQCTDVSQFKWVLSRINVGVFSEPDTEQCGGTRLPTETSVLDTDGCYISVSVGDANDKTTAPAEKQAVVLEKLQSILTCLP